MVSLDQMIQGEWIEGEQLSAGARLNLGPKFNKQLALLLAELHSLPHDDNSATYSGIPESNMNAVVDGLVGWVNRDEYCDDALYELYSIKSKLNKRFYLHGDLWRQNILVDEEGNLNGLRDWESLSYGDPHWDFRMVHRWIGWSGLEELLEIYHTKTTWKCNIEYIKILDRISVCNSIKIREERGPLRHDGPDTLTKFEEMKNISAVMSMKRTSTDVPFMAPDAEWDKYLQKNYIDTGLLISRKNILSEDKLTKESTTVWKDEDASLKYRSDIEVQNRRDKLIDHNLKHNIETWLD